MDPREHRPITGRVRRRETSLLVKVVDRFARGLITLAGIGTILAVSLVCVFLVWVVVPLFLGGEAREERRLHFQTGGEPPPIVKLAADEYQVLGWKYSLDGTLEVFRLDDGKLLSSRRLFDAAPTAYAFAVRDGHAIFGFEDGRVQFGTIRFQTSFLRYRDLDLHSGATDPAPRLLEHEDGIVELTPTGQYRFQRLEVALDEPVKLGSTAPVVLVDLSMQASGPIFCSLTADGVFRINGVRKTRNLMTGKETLLLSGGEAQVPMPEGKGLPRFLMLEGRADSALLVWEDGEAIRLDTRNRSAPAIVERLDLIEEEGVKLTSLQFLIGKMTLVAGDSLGRASTWFRTKPDYLPGVEPPTGDASILVKAQELSGEPPGAAVTSLAASSRTRMLIAGFADGKARLYHVTSGQLLAEMQVLEDGEALSVLAMSPKDDGMLAGSSRRLGLWRIAFPHPQTTLASIFTPVWYEGFTKPEHVWQSSSGTDEFEPKYGMVPLIFGTIKATFYTMLFGAPLALLAAIFTSEFLHRRTKAKIKPAIEMMASLPSVVLGFLAALVFAPAVERVVPGVLFAFVLAPFLLILSAFLWQLAPQGFLALAARFRFLFLLAVVPAGAALALSLGRNVEELLFAGDIMGWLAWQPDLRDPGASHRFRDATGGWLILFLPISALLTTALVTGCVNPIIRRRTAESSRTALAAINLLKFLGASAAAFALAFAASALLSSLGLDARGSYVSTYIQRNALIVGFVMGFAVIPIIYTIAEDALSSVPEHLRAASLGAGATQWQTAVRIVIPVAMSGLFSALMIGFGRAVGETMIVLMAAGNTPVLDWNIFNGFRTLSANIAVELPEAVQNGTNYRMLFLAALTLFSMTFAVNTVAESVRLRFRRRAFEL
jgi:phosphate transport system permease protein